MTHFYKIYARALAYMKKKLYLCALFIELKRDRRVKGERGEGVLREMKA